METMMALLSLSKINDLPWLCNCKFYCWCPFKVEAKEIETQVNAVMYSLYSQPKKLNEKSIIFFLL